MAGYKPLYIKANETGLVQDRVQHILPDDAYPILQNAYVWRERIKRKRGFAKLDRLRRILEDQVLTNTAAAAIYVDADILTTLGLRTNEPDAEIQPVTIVITIDSGGANETVIEDTLGTGVLSAGAPNNLNFTTGTVNYISGQINLLFAAPIPAGLAVIISFNYYPSLPVMGLRTRELTDTNNEQCVAFDTIYAYRHTTAGWQEFLPGTTWNGLDSDFFWSTNYWVGDGNRNIFWVTNFSGTGGTPIRYTNGVAASNWIDFTPQITPPAGTNEQLYQCLAMLPFRGRLMVFNTYEGQSLATSVNHSNRIRWAAIGNPFTTVSAIVSTVSPDAWRDDIPGKGGFLDIPTSEAIISVGFVRDNLVIYCERSTWQLRYTGRSIAPFQIEKVNSELGAESTFSAVQFDTSLVGIGDKGVVSCDSFKSERIDIKIPDLVFYFNNENVAQKRVHGVRDFAQRLAYWTYPYRPSEREGFYFPNRRLVYNYENDSWAIFTDSLTTLGTFQPVESLRWRDFPGPDEENQWQSLDIPWISRPSQFPSIIGGNQKGYVLYLDVGATNAPSLNIKNITGFGTLNTSNAVIIEIPNHNLEEGWVIEISGIIGDSGFANALNGNKYGVAIIDKDTFRIFEYSTQTEQFSIPALAPVGTYIGGGEVSIRDNFSIVSKKFNFLDEGQNIQLGYVDALFNTTDEGAVTFLVYLDYNDEAPSNVLPQNVIQSTSQPDLFFNSIVPTTEPVARGSNKVWQRVFCPSRASFLTIQWTLSNKQLIGPEQESDVEIQAQVLWIRKAGTQLPIGV